MLAVDEQLIQLSRAAALANPARPPHPQTLRRWAATGVNGQKLSVVRIGGQLFTSQRAIADFIGRLNEATEGM